MTLNQDICLRCRLKQIKSVHIDKVRESFLHDWKNFQVTQCNYEISDGDGLIDWEYTPIDEIPKHCPYALEHVVSEEETHVK